MSDACPVLLHLNLNPEVMGAAQSSLCRLRVQRCIRCWPPAFLFFSGTSNQIGAPWSLGGGTVSGTIRYCCHSFLRNCGQHSCKGKVIFVKNITCYQKVRIMLPLRCCGLGPKARGSQRKGMKSLRTAEKDADVCK